MGRVKKGKRAQRKDLWAMAGGMEALVRGLKSVHITKRDTGHSSYIWSELAIILFGHDDKKHRHWLWVVWTNNRKGLRDLINKRQKSLEQKEVQVMEENQNERDVGVECSEDCLSKDLPLSMIQHKVSDEDIDKNEAEDKQQRMSSQSGLEDDQLSDEDIDKNEAETEEQNLQRGAQDVNKNTGTKTHWRKLPVVSKRFGITVNRKKWQKIVPLTGSNKLRQPWTDVLYKSFREKNPCCTLAFKSHHIKTPNSRKIKSPYLNICAVCTFPSCRAKFFFKIQNQPVGDTLVKISVLQRGKMAHKANETKFRPAANRRRGRIARALHKGVSQVFYSKLKKTPVAELISGNISRSLNKNVLKVIRSEVRRGKRIHEDVFMEMYLTQMIIKECDSNYRRMPGYIQHFQVDPFGVHMYSETGVNIVVQHLRKKKPLTLYLDATGNVASKVPGQTKRVLYYCLTLPGGGQQVPPLPVCEMLTNEHSIPPITFWLMQFLRKLSQYTKIKVHQVETDYSWALLQSVLLSFNKESIVSYLDRAFAICSKLKSWKEIKMLTVLHICSAHVLKAVAQSIGRRTADKGLKDFATFAFARLQNATSMTTALHIFRSLCTVLIGKHNSNAVLIHLKAMKDFIKECRIPNMEEGDKLGDSPLTQEEDDEERRNAHTIVGRSPFTYEFRKVMEEVQGELEKEEVETPQDENPYFCPGIVDVLFDNYLGIFPLWSGLLLGNLKRYATDTEEDTFGQSKTRDTNCHVERWFGIVKHSILKKQRRLRPATFIRKMYGSLQGRYREHIMAHHLSEQLLLKTLLPKDISQSKEGWAKRDGAKPRTSSSKYYTTPDILPVPKRAKLTLNTGEDIQSSTDVENSSNPTSKGSKPATEVDALWTCKPTEVVVAVVRHAEEKHNFTLRHREFQSLRPDELIIGEVMECYIRGILNLKDNAGRLYLLDHYTMGVILHGTREQIARQELKKVTFDLYDGAIGFVNIRNVHWKFVYLHALSNHIYVVDPLQGSNEVEDSRKAAYKFGEYFKMRRNRLGKEDWVSIKWQPGKITHTFQKDATSCGAFVMQMAKMTVKEFPKIPKTFHIKSSQHLRRDMAEEILRGSVSKDDFCSFCGIEDLPTTAVDAVWIQCETCGRWFHTQCLGMPAARIPKKNTPWYCVLCILTN
ncbi:uncharacterized protein LOC117541546 isoform X2 [Gymnodraco acuticeps]|uniref:Uncharacterized protein LOC117541546 isoform X2 n=1 Tax=Gymnodraco acuticeps TaxID=8218 RepID=A0A6P8TKN2_GYMAC|nr:uncharacterized protein LOC117541546 isoform X2 [Gymnodraco acuticeps]